jgi:hypothetical protein
VASTATRWAALLCGRGLVGRRHAAGLLQPSCLATPKAAYLPRRDVEWELARLERGNDPGVCLVACQPAGAVPAEPAGAVRFKIFLQHLPVLPPFLLGHKGGRAAQLTLPMGAGGPRLRLVALKRQLCTIVLIQAPHPTRLPHHHSTTAPRHTPPHRTTAHHTTLNDTRPHLEPAHLKRPRQQRLPAGQDRVRRSRVLQQ